MLNVSEKFLAMPAAVRGALWMCAASVLLGVLSITVRHLSKDLHPFEIAFFRNLGQFALMLPWLLFSGIAVMKTKRIGAHVRRSLFGIVAMLSWFTVLALLPVAKATALGFSAPLFATVGAAIFLGETVRARRWSATALGFVGTLIIVRPGLEKFDGAELLALASAALIATALLSNKSLARTENPNAMVLWMGFFMTLFSIGPAIYVWQWPQGETWAWLGLTGVIATAVHQALNRAFKTSDASYVMPFGFVQLPAVALMGYFAFGEVADFYTWIGAAVIFASGVYIVHREARAAAKTHAPVMVQPQPAVQALVHEGEVHEGGAHQNDDA